MKFHNLRLSSFLFFLKFLGGFPYSAVDVEVEIAQLTFLEGGASSRSNSSSKSSASSRPHDSSIDNECPSIHFKKSYPWCAWSRCVLLLVLIYNGLIFWIFFISTLDSRMKHYGLNTLIIAMNAHQFCNLLFVNMALLYLYIKAPMFLQVITFLVKMCERWEIRPIHPLQVLHISLPLALVSSAYVVLLVGFAIDFYHLPHPHSIAKILDVNIIYGVNIVLLGLYMWIVHLICDLYGCLMTDLSRGIAKDHDDVDFESNKYNIQGNTFQCQAIPRTIQHQMDAVESEVGETMQCIGVITSIKGNGSPLQQIRKRLLEINQFRNLLNSYFGFLASIYFLLNMTTAIISFYYLSILSRLDPFSIIICSGFTISSLVPLVALPYMTKYSEEKMEEMRMLVRTLQYNPKNKEFRAEFYYVCKLIAMTPQFIMGNMFTLQREIICDVFGFIATYLVILLQFSYGEFTSQTSDNPGNVTGRA